MADEKKPETQPMRLKDGMRHSHDGVALKPGDVVDLTEAQRRAFGDKFVASDAPAPKPVEPTVPEQRPGATTHVPQDVQARNQSGSPTPETPAGSVQQPAPVTAPPVVTPGPPSQTPAASQPPTPPASSTTTK